MFSRGGQYFFILLKYTTCYGTIHKEVLFAIVIEILVVQKHFVSKIRLFANLTKLKKMVKSCFRADLKHV